MKNLNQFLAPSQAAALYVICDDVSKEENLPPLLSALLSALKEEAKEALDSEQAAWIAFAQKHMKQLTINS